MRGNVVVDTEQDYQAWLGEQQTFAQLTRAPADGRGGADRGDDAARLAETMQAKRDTSGSPQNEEAF